MPTESKRKGNMNRGQKNDGNAGEAARSLHVDGMPSGVMSFTRTSQKECWDKDI
jgi:hypothetical protein